MTKIEVKKSMVFIDRKNPYILDQIVTSVRKGVPYVKTWSNRLGKYTKPHPFGFGRMEDLIEYLKLPEVEVLYMP